MYRDSGYFSDCVNGNLFVVKELSNAFSLTGSGLRDWLVQRITSLIMLVYIIFLLSFFVGHARIDYVCWQALFTTSIVRLLSSLFLFSVIWHAWVGVWTVVTDYIKPFFLRLIIQTVVVVALLLYLMWGLAILWGH